MPQQQIVKTFPLLLFNNTSTIEVKTFPHITEKELENKSVFYFSPGYTITFTLDKIKLNYRLKTTVF